MRNSTLQEAWNLFYSDSEDIDTSYEKSVIYSAPSKTGSTALPQTSNTSLAHNDQNLVQELRNLRMQLNNLQYTYPLGSTEYESAVSVLDGKVESLLGNINSSSSPDYSPNKGIDSASVSGSSSSSSKNGDSVKLYSCKNSCCSGGRQFSNKSNLIRHQREQSGKAAKLRCSFCDARFSRSSARNAHEAERKCRS